MNQATANDGAPATVTDDLPITLKLPLSAVNFTLVTLNENPARGKVMEVAALIQLIRDQTQAQVNASLEQPAGAAPAKPEEQARRAKK